MHVLEHPAFGSIHGKSLQGRVDGMACRQVACPGVPESGVARFELGDQAVDLLLEVLGFPAH
jgi:hypothetical protein